MEVATVEVGPHAGIMEWAKQTQAGTEVAAGTEAAMVAVAMVAQAGEAEE